MSLRLPIELAQWVSEVSRSRFQTRTEFLTQLVREARDRA